LRRRLKEAADQGSTRIAFWLQDVTESNQPHFEEGDDASEEEMEEVRSGSAAIPSTKVNVSNFDQGRVEGGLERDETVMYTE